LDTGFTISPPHHPYPKTERQAEFIELGDRMAIVADANAMRHDRENSFPFDTFEALRESGYLALTAPEEYGGRSATPLEVMLAEERLARGDGAVALGAMMHLIQVAAIARSDQWPPELKDYVLKEVVARGTLLNNLASEPELGSPSRGGTYATRAVRDGDCWVINGRKTWSTLSPGLAFATVLLMVEEDDGSLTRGTFFVPMDTPGIRIENTWDSVSMRATGSNDVVFENVKVPNDYKLPQQPGVPGGNIGGWNLLGSAVHLGIATAARDFAINYAKTRKPVALQGATIATLQNVQHRIAQIEILLLQSRSVLYGAAELWEGHPEWRSELAWQLAAAKYVVTNNAIDITDQALRVVGSAGLLRRTALERYFRDVRAGLGNPPMDDIALTLIGKHALDVK
jgi:alkylation response protein AidB-like acyl-CoA dehydrogenase